MIAYLCISLKKSKEVILLYGFEINMKTNKKKCMPLFLGMKHFMDTKTERKNKGHTLWFRNLFKAALWSIKGEKRQFLHNNKSPYNLIKS